MMVLSKLEVAAILQSSRQRLLPSGLLGTVVLNFLVQKPSAVRCGLHHQYWGVAPCHEDRVEDFLQLVSSPLTFSVHFDRNDFSLSAYGDSLRTTAPLILLMFIYS